MLVRAKTRGTASLGAGYAGVSLRLSEVLDVAGRDGRQIKRMDRAKCRGSTSRGVWRGVEWYGRLIDSLDDGCWRWCMWRM